MGVGYHGQSYTGFSSTGNSDAKLSQVSSNSPLLPTSNSSNNMSVLPSKYSPNSTTPERNKTHRGVYPLQFTFCLLTVRNITINHTCWILTLMFVCSRTLYLVIESNVFEVNSIFFLLSSVF